MKLFCVLLFKFFILLPLLTWAQNVKRIKDYPQPKSVAVVKVNAQISRVDYDLLREDYSFMSGWDNEKIENWISHNLNILAASQAKQSEANTPIEYTQYNPPKKKQDAHAEPFVSGVYRPAEYGRALVIEVYDPKSNQTFYFDGKGLGGERPKPRPHETGLASFGEANREITMSALVDRALKNAGSKFSAVRCYFEFQYEFDMIEKISKDHAEYSRAGAVFRQNHLRPKKIISGYADHRGGADPATSLKVEKILRRYGITSTGSVYSALPGLSDHFDVTNVQITRDKLKLYDFGGYIVERDFHRPLLEWDSLSEYLDRYPATLDEFLNRIEKNKQGASRLILSSPGDSNFVQPDPEIRASFDFFGYQVTGYRSVRYDGPWIYAHNMDRDARAQGLNIIPRDWIEAHHRTVLQELNKIPLHSLCRLLL